MKKIILAIDGPQFSTGAKNALRYFAAKMKISVTGAFLENLFKYKIGKVLHGEQDMETDVEGEFGAYMDKTLHAFELFCTDERIPYAIHEIQDGYNQDALVLDSRYADLMLISSERFFHYDDEIEINPYVQKLLRHVECPVVIVPESFHTIESLIMTYDGSLSSAYAIKQFYTIFPEFTHLPVTLVSGIEDEHNQERMNAITQMEDYTKSHYSNFIGLRLPDMTPAQLESYAENKNSAMVITGSYGRSEVSMAWKNSFSHHLIRAHKVPVFIAHK